MTRYVKGMYRTENVTYNKLRQNEENNAANALRLADTLRIMRQSLLIQPDEECRFCKAHGEPIVNAYGMCVYCEDQLM